MGIRPHRLAKAIGVPQQRIGDIIAGKQTVTVGTVLRLSWFFGSSEGFSSGLQIDFDAAQAKDALSEVLERIRRSGRPTESTAMQRIQPAGAQHAAGDGRIQHARAAGVE